MNVHDTGASIVDPEKSVAPDTVTTYVVASASGPPGVKRAVRSGASYETAPGMAMPSGVATVMTTDEATTGSLNRHETVVFVATEPTPAAGVREATVGAESLSVWYTTSTQ